MFNLSVRTPGRKEVNVAKDQGGPAVYITGVYGDTLFTRADLLALSKLFAAAATMLEKESE